MVRPVHIFLCSPGDVAPERDVVRNVVRRLSEEPQFKDAVDIRIHAWDSDGGRAGLPAHITPQEALKKGLRRPANCDIVLCLFWSRMGSPLPADYERYQDRPYRSGSEWEFLDALTVAEARSSDGGRADGVPWILVYRYTDEAPMPGDRDARREAIGQMDRLDEFFDEFFTGENGSFPRGHHPIARAEFDALVQEHLRERLHELTTSSGGVSVADEHAGTDSSADDSSVPTPPSAAVASAFEKTHRAVLEGEELPPVTTEVRREVRAHRPRDVEEYRLARIIEWSAERYRLDRAFTRLTLMLDQGEEASGVRFAPQSESFDSLADVLDARGEDQAVVVLGAPGSGKSTLLRHFELESCEKALRDPGAAHPLTAVFALAQFRADKDGEFPAPLNWLAKRWEETFPHGPDWSAASKINVVLLLDGLNEVPGNALNAAKTWRAALSELRRARPGWRVAASCRSLDYSATLSHAENPVHQARVEPLSDPQIEDFLKKHDASALYAPLRASGTMNALRAPFYLKLVVDSHSGGEPTAMAFGRAALFARVIRQSLRRELERDESPLEDERLLAARDRRRLLQSGAGLPTSAPAVSALAALAFGMQREAAERGGQGGEVRVDHATACEQVRPVVPDPEVLLHVGESLGVLNQGEVEDEVYFSHQLFQEFFAAQVIAGRVNVGPSDKDEPSATISLASAPWRADEITPSLAETLEGLALADPLPAAPTTGWEETFVLAAALHTAPGEFIQALAEVNLPLAARAAASAEVNLDEALMASLRTELVTRLSNPAADIRARIAAAQALGELRDPRFPERNGPHGPYREPPLVQIPAGSYTVGSDHGDADEQPPHVVALPALFIGEFPVTNQEWQCFRDAGGYDDERWWVTDIDRAWQRGEMGQDGSKQQFRDFRQSVSDQGDNARTWLTEQGATPITVDQWLEFAKMSDKAFDGLLDRNFPGGKQTEPRYWHDSAYNQPGQPVVGVCWYEARAYCAWLSAQTGRAYRLATEAEWESAARGQARQDYPFPGPFDSRRANTFESHLRGTSPVGIYSAGRSAFGVQEMAGNVWEWTQTAYRPYSDDAYGLDKPDSDEPRVSRGGAWDLTRDLARVSFRDWGPPDDRDDDLGFRVVCESPIESPDA